ncbi:hypothetical protein M9Y10_028939 [Tritrichomonas musculus]|uniref:Uncharacterized protein n=1 Tax=Tritrichomonas musculus TaxID=1915356 RepID=A0ABR2KKR4_9EUKA
MSIDWKTIKADNVESIRHTPWNYVDALVQLGLWDKLTEAFYDETLSHYATDALLKPKARKNILKNASEDHIIHLLDTVRPPIRRHLLNILIEQSEDCPVSIQVGVNLLKNMDKHFWVYNNYQEVFSLQTLESLSVAFKARIKPEHVKNPVQFFRLCLNPEKSYDHKKDFLKPSYTYLTSSYFAPFRYLSKRVSFGILVTDLLIEALKGYAKKKRSYLNFVVQPMLDIFFQFAPIWNSNRNVEPVKEALSKLKDTLLKFPFHLTKKCNINLAITSNVIDSYFRISSFIEYKIITNEEYLDIIIPEALKHDLELPIEKTRFIKSIISSIFTLSGNENIVFFHALHTLSETLKDHPLAFLWPKLISLVEEFYVKEFNDSKYYFLSNLCRLIFTNNYATNLAMQTNSMTFTFDFAMGILVKIIRETIDHKSDIVKRSPELYTSRMKAIFTALLFQKDYKSDFRIWQQSQNLPFFLLPAELRDEIIAEFMCDPTGQKDYSVELTSEIFIVPLSIGLLFDDFKKMVCSISREKASKCDKFGFQDKIKFTYPSSLYQVSRKAEEAVEKVHVFERCIFPLLRDKDTNLALRAYHLYESFVDKLLTTAIRLDDKELYKLASDSHLRLCRFLNSKVNANIQASLISKYCDRIVSPISIYAGLKANNQYAQHLYDSSISKFPYTTETTIMPLLQILHVLLTSSYSDVLPGIGEVCGKLTTLILDRLFKEMPASFSNQLPNSYKRTTHGIVYLPLSETRIKAVKDLLNNQGNLLLPEKYMLKVLKNKFNRKKSNKINFSVIKGVYVDPSLLTPEFIKSFTSISIQAGAEPFLAVIEYLNQKKTQYKSEEYERPTTRLIEFLIQTLKNDIFHSYSYDRYLPVVPFNYEKQNCEKTYTHNIKKWFTTTFDVNHSTACIAHCLLPHDTFLYRLFTNKSLNFETLDEVLVYKPLSKLQEETEKKNPNKKKEHITITVTVNPKPDQSVLLRLKKHDQKPNPKAPHCPRCGHKEPKAEKGLPKSVGHEDWMDTISWELIKPLLETDASAFCEAVKNDGLSLFKIVRILYINLKKNSKCEASLNLIASLLDMCFKDILIEDPEPTEENRNPKPTPTLFMDENGQFTGTIPPFIKNKAQKAPRVVRGRRTTRGRRAPPPKPVKPTTNTSGQPKFQQTKVLIAHLASILSYDIAKGNVDMTILSKSLIDLLSLDPPNIKKKIGDDNYSFYTDHIASALLNHINFGNQIKDLKWANKFESPIFESFFRLFACDATHHNALEWANQLLLSLSRVEERNAIISSFVSALSEKTGPNYTLHTRTRTVAWCLDHQYVGCPLPKYCIDYVQSLSEDKILHIDIRRAIAAGSVAYFKWRAIANANTDQYEELFKVLQNIYDTARNNMAPTFCQLIRPKYCLTLSRQSPLYKSLMPSTSLPESYITPQHFGRLSMPHTNEWKVPHQRFVSTFIGNSLLSKDENVIQLAIQVLTKLKIRGGETAEKIAPFIITAFKEFNVLLPSAILINFMFNFCIQKPHSEFAGLIDGFVSIFAKTRKELDIVNDQQIKLFWTNDDKFRQEAYQPLSKVCDIFADCIESRVNDLTEKEDFKVAQDVARKVIKALDGDKQLTMFFKPFVNLREKFEVIANDHLIQALMTQTPSEDSLRNLLIFIRETCQTSCHDRPYPQFVDTLFYKHRNLLSLNLVKEELCKWPVEIGQDRRVVSFLHPLFNELVLKIGKDNEEFIALLPKIWMLVNMQGTYDYRAYEASSAHDSIDFRMMASNSLTVQQMVRPKILGAIGASRANYLSNINQPA